MFPEADLIIVIESDVPWFPTQAKPKPGTKVIQIGIDPFFSRYPMRTFPADIPISSDPRVALIALREALAPYRLRKRKAIRRAMDPACRGTRGTEKGLESRGGEIEKGPADRHGMAFPLHRERSEDGETVLINEYDLRTHQVSLNEPGTFFGSPMVSGLGWCFGAALGVKLARPEAVPIVCMGDGVYHFTVPNSCHFMAQRLPVVAVDLQQPMLECGQRVRSRSYIPRDGRRKIKTLSSAILNRFRPTKRSWRPSEGTGSGSKTRQKLSRRCGGP